MDLTFKEELYSDIVTELRPIFEVHWKELANNQDIRPLEVDDFMYSVLSSNGTLRWFCVRDAGVLIGYASFCMANHLHYKHWKYAVCDIYYIKEEFRKKGVGTQLFNEVEKWLKSQGVMSITVQDKLTQPHGKMFEAHGYKAVETHYEKII